MLTTSQRLKTLPRRPLKHRKPPSPSTFLFLTRLVVSTLFVQFARIALRINGSTLHRNGYGQTQFWSVIEHIMRHVTQKQHGIAKIHRCQARGKPRLASRHLKYDLSRLQLNMTGSQCIIYYINLATIGVMELAFERTGWRQLRITWSYVSGLFSIFSQPNYSKLSPWF